MRVNAADKPRYVVSKTLAGDRTAYYWSPNARLMKDAPFKRRPLGMHYSEAKIKADKLTADFDFWRATGRLPDEPAEPQLIRGTFDHMLAVYKKLNPSKEKSYNNMRPKSQKHFDYLTKRVADHVLKDGRRVGSCMVKEFNPRFADALYEKLVVKPRPEGAKGPPELRRRSTNEAMAYCRLSWSACHRAMPELVPAANPFSRMGLDSSSKETVPATYEQLLAFEDKAVELGEPIPAFVARCAWELLQRVEEINAAFEWAHWRPASHPNEVWVANTKTDAKIWKPLRDAEGQFYVELEQRLMACPRIGGHVCMIRWRKGNAPKTGEDNRAIYTGKMGLRELYNRAARIRKAAGLPDHVTLASFRHGGLTELGDAGLPDTWAQAQSRHKQRATLDRYIHRTGAQIAAGSRLRLAHRRGKT